MGKKVITHKEAQRFLKQLLRRKKTAHKGDFGRVLVVGGSEQYIGAIALGSLAVKSLSALRVGIDIVTVASPSKVAWAMNTLTPDLITVKLNWPHLTTDHVYRILQLSEKHDVVLIGPGLGLHLETQRFVTKVVRELVIRNKSLVIDADALKVVSLQEIKHAILTPHAAELQILLNHSGILEQYVSQEAYATIFMQKKFQELLGTNVLLLKGSVDTIVSSNNICYNHTGNPGMTVGGTGDVLAGICAGFLCRTNDPFSSACCAAYLNGWIGDLLKEELGYGFIASDFLPWIPKAIKAIATSVPRHQDVEIVRRRKR
ncbi:NAD(P)H-hydrate dehydratase [Candidatus Woesearchaeota archaeon]|nr:NAD(P)H-hydrate dehydratase [Candidatus Woesearchaeota archaeon]